MSSLVPDGWAIKPLVELASVDRESLKNSTQPDYKFWYIDIASVKTGAVSVPAEPMVFSDSPSRARKRVCKGDVLMSTVRPNLKSFAYFDKDGDDYIASTGFAVITAKPSSNGKFIYQSILADDVTRQIAGLVAGSNYPAISSLNVKNLELLAPPLPEQQKIAAILSTVDDVIEKTCAQIDKLKDLKTGMMQELLTKGIGPGGVPHTEFKDSPVGRIPVGWNVVPISAIVEKVIDNRGKTPPISHSGYELLEINSIKKDDVHPDYEKVSKFIDEETYRQWFRAGHPKSGDILIPTVGTIGSCSLVCQDRGCIAQNIIALRLRKGVDTRFAYYVLSSQFTVRQIEAILMNAVQPSLRVPHFLMLHMVLPNESEQTKIGEALGSIDAKLTILREKSEVAIKLKKALMQDLLTGKVRVKIDDKESAVA
ncbi:restriction endonuclease subunit S [uncultured Zhongshania sp.]|uniref:restriction endonuclease subunit S n=1 Tax=uncultured Zhongshania sp. TaxID=1642288 RepID=UPI0030D8C8B1|tara:strand:- start:6 stop:1280 length:1275 start_codon:yes stop_codon:yes gene_type:complete